VAKSIKQSTKAYERWLKAQLGGDIVKDNLREKHKKMAKNPFVFLRATYWRWAETIFETCPGLADAPTVLAVGDIHLENFGTWRDADGRLVWGVNDFDEAAEMPYAVDLVRLATSAVLAADAESLRVQDMCEPILEGYEKGLTSPRAVVLDQKYEWLREAVEVKDKARREFWDDMDALEPAAKDPLPRYVKALTAALPEHDIDVRIRPRQAGAGSLGRPRWVAIGEWRGAPVVREAKVLVPSAWNRINGRGFAIRWNEIASGSYRAADPWYRLTDNIVVRRLSPNNRKIEAKDEDRTILLKPKMLRVMARELASIHLGSIDRSRLITKDLARRKKRWLAEATEAAAKQVTADFKRWAAHRHGTKKR
jgi:hypothetical protein